jgi:hypothetical protein
MHVLKSICLTQCAFFFPCAVFYTEARRTAKNVMVLALAVIDQLEEAVFIAVGDGN